MLPNNVLEELVMKKVFQLSELDCAACADRMETAIRKLPGVTAATVNFVTQRLTLEADDATFEEVVQAARKVAARTAHGCILS